MIRRIQQVSGFGVYRDFRWSAQIPEFTKLNLIYGWNYSGKTTISRAFRCFEKNATHPDFPEGNLKLVDDGGVVHTFADTGTLQRLRVFNSDFVREHLHFEECAAAPFLVLGAEDISLREEHDKLTARRTDMMIRARDIRDDARSIRESINQRLRQVASDRIKNGLRIPDYDRTNLLPAVQTVAGNPDDWLLSESEFANAMEAYWHERSDKIKTVSKNITPVADLIKEATEVMKSTVTNAVRLRRFLADADAEQWASQGRLLHLGANECFFCGQPISEVILNELEQHFSAEYAALMRKTDDCISKCESALAEPIPIPDVTAFPSGQRELFLNAVAIFKEAEKERQITIGLVLKYLQRKSKAAFQEITYTLYPTQNDDSLRSTIDGINDFIDYENRAVDDATARRAEAFLKIERHVAADFAREFQYRERAARADYCEKLATGWEEAAVAVSSRMDEITRELSNSAKAIERLNSNLGHYFPDNRLQVGIRSDGRFELRRGEQIAKNLSEGERTIVALCYFVSRLQDGNQPLNELCVFVDDPISSLDGSHLFNTYAFIKLCLKNCKQVFVSTHNYDFFNLLRDWTKKITKNDWKAYIIQRLRDGSSRIEVLPEVLWKFKSEYHYLFSKLREFDRAGGGEIESLLSLSNCVRRFMEAFGAVMIPTHEGLEDKLDRLIPDEVARERVLRFMHHHSHGTGVMRAVAIPDLSECVDVTKICLNAVKAWDEQYFDQLCANT